MNVFIIIIFCIFIASIYAEFNIIYHNPNTHEFKVEIGNEVNRTAFPSYIRIYKNTTMKELVYEIDASVNNTNITYVNKKLIFHTPDSIRWNMTTGYYITLDEDVPYSNNRSNLTARVLKFAADETFSAESTTISATVTTDITTTAISGSNISSLNNTNKATKSSTTLRTLRTGESSSTRSAQIGMGLGITLIGIIIIGEIIYFKYFYHGNLQRDNHIA